MPSKRKRDLLDFDPNKSDSNDDDFEPGEDRPRVAKKKSRSSRGNSAPTRKKRARYAGSDIVDDEDDASDSGEGGSYGQRDDDDDDDDDDDKEDDELHTNSAGRKVRKAAVQQKSYRESSEESMVEDTDHGSDADQKPTEKPAARARPSRIVTLKTRRFNLRTKEPPTPSTSTRRTRAHTEEAEDFVELSTSGKHALPARASRSKSPEALAQTARATRGSKGIKKPAPATIEEATQESSSHGNNTNHDDPLAADGVNDEDAPDQTSQVVEDAEAAEKDDAAEAAADEAVEEQAVEDEDMQIDTNEAAEEDDDDIQPVTRRTRSFRDTAAAIVREDEADDELGQDEPGRRMTRGSRRLRNKKAAAEASSDFEPVDDDSAEEGASVAGARRKRSVSGSNGDEDVSSQNSRGRRGKGRPKKQQVRESEDEDIDRDELAQEAEELRASSHSRPRRRRSPSIVYEDLSSKRRRVTKPVDYSIKPLDHFLAEPDEDDQEPAQTPARRKNGRAGGGGLWQRNLLSTFGPFGGGGGVGSLLGGPWGAGATGGVESDSSDDERVHRSGVGGNIGMTPTSAAVPGFAAPLNLGALTGEAATPNVGKVKNQKAFADADPLGVDTTVDFSKVGGLQNHINQLKEMVTLPLLYPELFLRFKVTPPRGVLFHGPPGTGKTLLARALANSIGVGGRKITFYMRKGADALSKWVGEAEKQLRLLFEEARRTQPSIIFFDEIDGLAPVRSSKQEQIHASIVSTLLALMDGMDGRGQVIVVGATNRPDNIDPALRRPGRFDREFYFPLPDLEGRSAILDIHTKDWGLASEFKQTLAENTKGYGGADLRALCTEAALNAIQRTYPQIYTAPDKLVVDPDKIDIHAADFMISMKRMIPSSERSASSGAAPLPKAVEPLLRTQFAELVKLLDEILPRKKKITALEEAMFELPDDADQGFGRETMNQEFERSRIFRPRLLLTSIPGMGLGYLCSAILHHLEGVHVQNFDLPTLLGDGRPVEQVIVSLFVEVKRHKPAVIFIPNIDAWQMTLPDAAYTTFKTMLKSIPPNDPVLVIGTAELEVHELPEDILRELFGFSKKNRMEIDHPNREGRFEYFSNVTSHITKVPSEFPDPSNRKKRVLEALAVAPPPPVKPRTKAELKEELKKDHLLLNLLKVQLQPIMDQIKKYKKFRQPVIPESQIQYLFQEAEPTYVRPDVAPGIEFRPYEIDKDKDEIQGLRDTVTGKFYYNLDLATIEERLSNGYYARARDFYKDVCSLAKDAKNIGDKERVLKANELVTNVEVDVAEAEARLVQANWDELYQRQLQRSKAASDKERKRKAAVSMVSLIQSDAPDSESQIQIGPVRIGEPMPGTTSARFRLMSPNVPSNGRAAEADHSLSNGTSVPSRTNGEDTEMGGVDEERTQPFSQMGPPSQWPQAEHRSAELSGRATAGNTQVSQVSALTTIPPGVSPSAILNDASTTKTSDPSTNRSSGHWSTQATNGVHSDPPDGSQLPDTQPMGDSGPSQGASSDGVWPHSQAQGLARGILQPRLGLTEGLGSGQTTPTSSQAPSSKLAERRTQATVANLLNDDSPAGSGSGSAGHQSLRNSGASSASSQPQPIIPPDSRVSDLLKHLTDRTSGCTVEQLEQINRELMNEVWRTRHDFNRAVVLGCLSRAFNDTIADIETLQGPLP